MDVAHVFQHVQRRELVPLQLHGGVRLLRWFARRQFHFIVVHRHSLVMALFHLRNIDFLEHLRRQVGTGVDTFFGGETLAHLLYANRARIVRVKVLLLLLFFEFTHIFTVLGLERLHWSRFGGKNKALSAFDAYLLSHL